MTTEEQKQQRFDNIMQGLLIGLVFSLFASTTVLGIAILKKRRDIVREMGYKNNREYRKSLQAARDADDDDEYEDSVGD